jgi:phosphoglycerate dehydrogenase-like enzyme
MENGISNKVNPQEATKTIGIVGAGHIAQAVARHAAKAGYKVIISCRKKPVE